MTYRIAGWRACANSTGARRRILAAAVAAFVAGCDRPRTPDPVAAGTAAADTVVRREVRRVASPSAIQRITGPATARRAGVPLDSVLAVRVLDVRGDEFPGALVEWRLVTAATGARLDVENGVTDSNGSSRARLVPGRSADPQVVSAEVAGVGRIDFTVVVPAASARVDGPASLWSGERAVFTATLRDSAATPLEGGRVHWASTDSQAIRLAGSDSQRVVATAALAGTAEVRAWSGSARGTARVTVRPELDLAVSAMDGAAVEAEARVVSPARIPLEALGGRFRARIDAPVNAELSIDIEPADSARYHRARLRVAHGRELQALRVVVIPRRWRIDRGAHAGRDVPVDANLALTPVAGRAPFWRMAPASRRGLRTILGWHPARLPIPIAFDRAGSSGSITAADSTAFWAIARQLERDLGHALFRPASMDDADAVRVEVRPGSSEGHTFTSSAGDGDVIDGTLLFRAPATLRDPHVVTHELVHLLGFGHSVSWPSIAVPSGGGEPRLTPQDVAYMQLAMRLRATGLTIGFPRRP